ncbi:hypothetical protein ROJ8625_00304 [Roseivivax jejudonensis]|uniref:Uncharacterized protein n=1 Tax=Roseivivax jejudonensis TaxID=1529041 RepID=A0A1X6Y6M6_9RHOB|nr:hypothetical protein [Roseivivax jejudonensis]SLN12053.1 hypothetical protein ROJ8625_00304 [Roseivivax jejudonensis]
MTNVIATDPVHLAPAIVIATAAALSASAYPQDMETPVKASRHFTPELQIPKETRSQISATLQLEKDATQPEAPGHLSN